VAVAVFGDGASNIGAFHEGLNLAAVWRLPVVFVCENNLYGEYSPLATTTAVTDIADRAAAYRIPGEVVDGQALDQVADAVRRAVDRARSGGGPSLLEMKTYRYAGHSRSDPAAYRPDGELQAWQARDPINLHARQLIKNGEADAATLDRLAAELTETVITGIERAKAGPTPPIEAMHRHIRADREDTK
jgi:pyruvate dehydrogenase E1 component alpha subunit